MEMQQIITYLKVELVETIARRGIARGRGLYDLVCRFDEDIDELLDMVEMAEQVAAFADMAAA